MQLPFKPINTSATQLEPHLCTAAAKNQRDTLLSVIQQNSFQRRQHRDCASFQLLSLQRYHRVISTGPAALSKLNIAAKLRFFAYDLGRKRFWRVECARLAE